MNQILIVTAQRLRAIADWPIALRARFDFQVTERTTDTDHDDLYGDGDALPF